MKKLSIHLILVMDEYDPLDAFLASNEKQLELENQQLNNTSILSRKSSKRGFEDTIDVSNPQEVLLKGLQKPMSSDSFGLRMLQKMGYQEGEGLGKDGNGIKEPIQVKLKYDKLGIGTEEAEKKKKEEEEYNRNLKAIRSQLEYNQRKSQFQAHVKEKQSLHNLSKDLRQAQTAIEWLDEDNGRPRNALLLDMDESYDADVLIAHLGKMISYLRSTYFYCIYCGCSYSDEADLNANCPGWDRSCH